MELWPIGKIRLNETNPNKHTLEHIEQLAAALKEWGWTMPLLVDEDGLLLAGHGRIRAARLMGFDEAPVIVAKGWSEGQKRAYVVADNQLARNSEWDSKLLRAELKAIALTDFDMTLIGISDDDMRKMMIDPTAAPTEPTDVHMQRCPTCGSLKRKIKGET